MDTASTVADRGVPNGAASAIGDRRLARRWPTVDLRRRVRRSGRSALVSCPAGTTSSRSSKPATWYRPSWRPTGGSPPASSKAWLDGIGCPPGTAGRHHPAAASRSTDLSAGGRRLARRNRAHCSISWSAADATGRRRPSLHVLRDGAPARPRDGSARPGAVTRRDRCHRRFPDGTADGDRRGRAPRPGGRPGVRNVGRRPR